MVLIKKYFVQRALREVKIDEYLAKRFYRAGYAGVKIIELPVGHRVYIYAERPGMIIGRGGQTIRELQYILENHFGLNNPQVSVRRVEDPDLNARVVASRIAVLLERGAHYRRVAHIMARRVLAAGALGVEIVISGKLRTERARYEKLKLGKVYSTGYQVEHMVDRAVMHVLLKPGVYGIEVKIVKPVRPVDYVKIKTPEEAKEVIEKIKAEMGVAGEEAKTVEGGSESEGSGGGEQ